MPPYLKIELSVTEFTAKRKNNTCGEIHPRHGTHQRDRVAVRNQTGESRRLRQVLSFRFIVTSGTVRAPESNGFESHDNEGESDLDSWRRFSRTPLGVPPPGVEHPATWDRQQASDPQMGVSPRLPRNPAAGQLRRLAAGRLVRLSAHGG